MKVPISQKGFILKGALYSISPGLHSVAIIHFRRVSCRDISDSISCINHHHEPSARFLKFDTSVGRLWLSCFCHFLDWQFKGVNEQSCIFNLFEKGTLSCYCSPVFCSASSDVLHCSAFEYSSNDLGIVVQCAVHKKEWSACNFCYLLPAKASEVMIQHQCCCYLVEASRLLQGP